MQMADNAGASDEHRPLNDLAVRYPALYTTAAEAHWRNSSFSAVDVRPSPVGGTRRIVGVIFSFRHRQTDAVGSNSVTPQIGWQPAAGRIAGGDVNGDSRRSTTTSPCSSAVSACSG
jgi:PatG C-terminal